VFIAGKTGTTENYGDAWFVGFTDKLTVAVWVGYPDTIRSMKTEFRGGPVAGGTFPAAIWHDFMTQALRIQDARAAAERAKKGLPQEPTTSVSTAPVAPAPTTSTAPSATPKHTSKPRTPAKTPAPKATPTPAQPPADQQPGGEDTGGTGAGAGGTATP
jgi:penicillin-binding protein 1A